MFADVCALFRPTLCQQRKGHNNYYAGYQVLLRLAGPFQLVTTDICRSFCETSVSSAITSRVGLKLFLSVLSMLLPLLVFSTMNGYADIVLIVFCSLILAKCSYRISSTICALYGGSTRSLPLLNIPIPMVSWKYSTL